MTSSVPPYPPSRNLLEGKSVVITAAAGTGIGFATAKRCLEEGGAVLLSDWHERRLDEAVEQLRLDGNNVSGVVCDVTKEEDVQGIPFVGKAGQLLNKMLAAINLNRENVYITNIVPWRPPGNRQPTNDEILMCVPFVQRHIELINPKVLVLLGGTATKALLLSDAGIMRLQGKWHQYSSYGLASPIATRPVFHPAFLLRSPGYKKNAWEDLKEIKLKLGN